MHSHSSTTQFNNCPYAYRLYKLGYRKQEETASDNDRVWGVAAHKALQVIHSGGSNEQAYEAFSVAYPVDLSDDDRPRSREAMVHTLSAYRTRYYNDPNEWETIATEFDNKDDVDDGHSRLVIDMVARHRASGSIYFWDHKVKRKFDGGKGYELDAQLSRYTEYVRSKWGDCAGALVNIIVPHYRERKWRDRPAGWDIQLVRQMYSRTTDQVEVWRRSQDDWERLMGFCNDSGVWPRHYGKLCSWCAFYEHCYADQQGSGQEVLDALYTPLFDPVEEVANAK